MRSNSILSPVGLADILHTGCWVVAHPVIVRMVSISVIRNIFGCPYCD